ncbi:MBL fold metallo-hydrolase [Kangiella sp. TOML190]|uniref:MBL fold metallo-hydrolase n=1 Tax=Kangiella sp. TOML190 TaxID=2931351 RepID=UPI002041C6F1|nr:MBL fold metallo-hydrolase [Kangiella sp. TOML190]
MSLSIRSFYHNASGTWSYLVTDQPQRKCAIIDPVMDFDLSSGSIGFDAINPIIEIIETESLQLVWILETHAHADHLTAANYVKQKLGGKTVIGAGITAVQQHFAQVFNLDIACDGSQFDRLVSEGDRLALGDFSFEVYSTPGHTSDSIIYKIADNIFLGDTFFHPNSGTARCDFPGGDAATLFQSLSKILSFSEQSRLWLCHDYPGNDREPIDAIPLAQMKQNIHIQNAPNQASYVELRQSRDSQLAVPKLLYPALQVNICAGQLPQAESNGANYLKIPLRS